jgi:hypothetical protein
MADLGKLERTDERKATDGIVVPYKADITFRIAKMFNPRYNARSRELGQGAYRPRLRAGGKMAQEAAEEMLTQLAAETLLLDWSHVEIDGEPLPYSVENAMRILREFPDVRRFVIETAAESEPYRLRDDEEAVGNSAAPSGGTSGGARKNNG